MEYEYKGLKCEVVTHNPNEGKGGQHAGLPILEVRAKCEDFQIEVRVRHHRSQYKNMELAKSLLELGIDSCYKG